MGNKPIMGFPSTSQHNCQLNVTNTMRRAAGSFGRRENKITRRRLKVL